MKRQTRRMLLNLFTGVAVAATAAVVFLPAAQAAPGYATSNVNVRSGPGTSYAVVDTLIRGQQVDVQRCQGTWCYVVKPGPDGWVSSSYLATSPGGQGTQQPNISFGFSVGPGGPSISFGIGDPRPPIVSPPPQVRAQACFYEASNYRGQAFCLQRGQSTQLPRFSDGIGSIDNRYGLSVEVCGGWAGRDCRTYTTNAANLGFFGSGVTSIRVR